MREVKINTEDINMNERVLLADDAPFMRMLQKKTLEQHGYQICGETSSGVDAAEMYEELQPDIMVLGLIFPETDGLEILKNIKREYPEAKIIMCSSLSQETSVADSLAHGAANFIVKPFQAEFFAHAVKSALESTKISALLNRDALNEWHGSQNNYPPNEKLSQEQINIITDSYYRLYPGSP